MSEPARAADDAAMGDAIREELERQNEMTHEEQKFSVLNQLTGTNEAFAAALWRFWISEDGPGWQQHKVLKCPLSIAKRPVELERLWKEVNKRGGYDNINAHKLWSTVGKFFNPPPTCTNLSFIVKRCYTETLLPLEYALREGKIVAGIELPEPDPSVMPEPRSQTPSQKRSRSNAGLQYGDYPKGKRVYGREIIGRHVKVFWPKYKKTYHGQVVDYSEETKNHLVHYKDGEQKWTNFATERRYSFVEAGAARGAAADLSPQSLTGAGSDLLGSPYDGAEEDRLDHPLGGDLPRQYNIPLVDESHNRTGAIIKVSNTLGPPQVCGITQVEETEDGYEIFALLPGLTLDDVSVSCTQEGKVTLDGSPQDTYTSKEVGLQPIHQSLDLPAKLNVDKTIAILTLHGLLYIKVIRL